MAAAMLPTASNACHNSSSYHGVSSSSVTRHYNFPVKELHVHGEKNTHSREGVHVKKTRHELGAERGDSDNNEVTLACIIS